MFSNLAKKLMPLLSVLLAVVALISVLPAYKTYAAQADVWSSHSTVKLSSGSVVLEVFPDELTIEEDETASLSIYNKGTLAGHIYAKGDVIINGQNTADWQLIAELGPGESKSLTLACDSADATDLAFRLVQNNCVDQGFIDIGNVHFLIGGEAPVWPDLGNATDSSPPYYIMDRNYHGDQGSLNEAVLYIDTSSQEPLPVSSERLISSLVNKLYEQNSVYSFVIKDASYVDGKGVRLVIDSSSFVKQFALQLYLDGQDENGNYKQFILPYQHFTTFSRRIFLRNDLYSDWQTGINTASKLKIGGDKSVSTEVVTISDVWNEPSQSNVADLPLQALSHFSVETSSDAFQAVLDGNELTIEQKTASGPATVSLYYNYTDYNNVVQKKLVLTRTIEPLADFE